MATPVTVDSVVPRGEQLRLGAGARVELMLPPDLRVLLRGPGLFDVLPAGLPWPVRGIAPSVRRVPPVAPPVGPAAVALQSRSPLEAPPPLALLEPADTAIADREPVLRWAAPGDDAETARVDLAFGRLEPDGSFTTLERWEGLVGTSHRLWAPLERGRFYRWQLRPAGRADVEPASAWLFVAPSSQVRALEDALRLLTDVPPMQGELTPSRRALEALLCGRHGFFARAERLWRTLLQRRPEDPTLRARVDRLARRQLVPLGWVGDTRLPFGADPRAPAQRER